MKKVLFFIIIFSVSSFADVEERRDKILKLIDSEVQEISRLVKQTRGSNPNFILRLSELYFEQARLLHERELDRFKNLSSEQKDAIDKRSFYAESRNKFENAQKTAKFLLKNYPRYPQKGDVYYILAKNSMEFQDTKSASEYFNKAYSNAGGNDELKEKAGVSMAENYYNNKKYAQAIPLYEKALVGKKDKWWTKDAYNLAWCYYRTHNYSKAINLMHEVHKISKQDGFVNFGPQVERDLAFFYTSAGRTDEAIKFYRDLGVDIPSKLIAVSKFLKEIGKFTESEKILILALNNNPNPEQESEIYASLLDYYEKYGLYQKHLSACKRLADLEKRGKLSSDIHETLVLQAQTVSGTLQKQVAGKTYEKQPEVRRSKGELAIEYFKILLEVDPKNNEKWNLAIAETYRSIRQYEQAIPFYFAANKSANEKGDNNIANLSVNGLMLALDNPAVSKATRDRYTISAYSLSLRTDPKSQKALTIYQRIFSYYISKGMMTDAEKILMDFKENFPGSTAIQEAMIAKIIDYYKNTKNYAEVERWSKRVASGEFNVSSEYNKQVRLQFVSTKLEKATNKGQALEGYLEIYNNEISPRGSKVSAAYNISVIYFEIGDPEKTFQWTEKALSLANANEVSSNASSYQAIGKDFFGRRQFDRASIIYDKLLRGICSQKTEVKQEVFAELIFIDISQKDFQQSHDRIENFKQCGISDTLVNSLKSELLEEMVRYEEIGLFQGYLNDYSRNPQMASYLIKPLGDLRNNYLKNGLLDKADQVKSQIYETYQKGLKTKVKYSNEAKDVYASLELENLRREVQRMASINLVFPESEFQAGFKNKFTSLERIISSANKIASLGSGQAAISAFRNLSYSYRNFAQSVSRVVPTGKPPAFIESFRKAMSPYTTPFTQKAQDLENRARKIINDNDILSKDNAYFLSSMLGDIVIEYNFPKGGIPMDRSGSP